MRRRSATFATCIGALFALTGAAADQTDPRLPGLLARLGEAPNRAAAHDIEQQIWSAWFASPGSSAEQELMRARESAEGGAMDEAMAHFDALVTDHPDYAEGWNQRAILRYLLGDVAGSLADIERVLALEPRHFGALSGRGQCYLRMERYRDALDAFEQALAINPWIESTARQIEMLRAIVNQQRTPI